MAVAEEVTDLTEMSAMDWSALHAMGEKLEELIRRLLVDAIALQLKRSNGSMVLEFSSNLRAGRGRGVVMDE